MRATYVTAITVWGLYTTKWFWETPEAEGKIYAAHVTYIRSDNEVTGLIYSRKNLYYWWVDACWITWLHDSAGFCQPVGRLDAVGTVIAKQAYVLQKRCFVSLSNIWWGKIFGQNFQQAWGRTRYSDWWWDSGRPKRQSLHGKYIVSECEKCVKVSNQMPETCWATFSTSKELSIRNFFLGNK